MNYWRLRIECGPIFRRLLKSQLGTVGVWVAFDFGNRIAIGGGVEIQVKSKRDWVVVQLNHYLRLSARLFGVGDNFSDLRSEVRRS